MAGMVAIMEYGGLWLDGVAFAYPLLALMKRRRVKRGSDEQQPDS